MALSDRLEEYIAAAFSGLWIQSFEHEDALQEIAQMCKRHNWVLAVWDIDRGFRMNGQTTDNTTDPVAAIRAINGLVAPSDDGSALLVLPNFHRFMNSAEISQALAHQIHEGKQSRTFIVVLSPLVQIPIELEKQFVVLEHELPDRDQIEQIARGIATEPGELPEDEDQLGLILNAAVGLTRLEAESAFSLSLVRHKHLRPQTIWELKSQMLKKSGLLQLHRGHESFADLGGLDALKSFCTRALQSRHTTVKPRGILLLGVPGTGKSALAKALGNETNRPTLHLDVGTLFGSLVGQTEQNVRQALRIADSMAPSILFVDEIAKALAGGMSAGQADSGVTARLFGSLLTWLSDHESDVFFVGTCNDISKLPPEFSRAERFDGVFFLDLPTDQERQAIWQLYISKFELEGQDLPSDENWTGAEIRSCCRLARLLDVSLVEAATHVVPVALTAGDAVERLRSWASGRCLSASTPGIYQRQHTALKQDRRRAITHT